MTTKAAVTAAAKESARADLDATVANFDAESARADWDAAIKQAVFAHAAAESARAAWIAAQDFADAARDRNLALYAVYSRLVAAGDD